MWEAEPAGGAVGQCFDGAGFPPAMTVVAAPVTDRHLRPGQRLQMRVASRENLASES
ncbi:hypothetical protein GCM10022251_53620 [Phytohabitans flavus]